MTWQLSRRDRPIVSAVPATVSIQTLGGSVARERGTSAMAERPLFRQVPSIIDKNRVFERHCGRHRC